MDMSPTASDASVTIRPLSAIADHPGEMSSQWESVVLLVSACQEKIQRKFGFSLSASRHPELVKAYS